MLGAGVPPGRAPAHRFTLLLLEEGEDYVTEWIATCNGPPAEIALDSAARLPDSIRVGPMAAVRPAPWTAWP